MHNIKIVDDSIIFKGEKKLTLSEYKDLSVIGHGANAVVLRGMHTVTHRIDAIKIYLPNKRSKDGRVSLEQFLEETRKLSSLNDPRYATVYNAICNNDFKIVVMEYIPGITLNEWVKQNHSQYEKIQLAISLFEAILNYQRIGVIHGDIHDRNIIVGKNGKIHIIDFGSSYFSNGNQSFERESYLVYSMVEKILKDLFYKECFTISTGTIFGSYVEHDVRLCDPLLVSMTILAYCYSLDSYFALPPAAKPSDIVELIVKLTHGIYIDFEKCMLSLYDKVKPYIKFESILQIFYENIDERVIPDYIDDDTVAERIEYDTLMAYYEIVKKVDIDWDKAKKYTRKIDHTVEMQEYDDLVKLIKQNIVDIRCRPILYEAFQANIEPIKCEAIIWQYYAEIIVKRFRDDRHSEESLEHFNLF